MRLAESTPWNTTNQLRGELSVATEHARQLRAEVQVEATTKDQQRVEAQGVVAGQQHIFEALQSRLAIDGAAVEPRSRRCEVAGLVLDAVVWYAMDLFLHGESSMG